VHAVVLPTDSDLTVTVDSGTYAVVAMREMPCTDGAPERVCRGGGVQSLRFHGLPAGTYYFVVESPNLGAYTITATAVTPPVVPTVATGNDLCGGATVVPPTGGYFTGRTLTMPNQFFGPAPRPLSCGVAQLDEAHVLPSHLVAVPDGALYEAKRAGRNRVEVAQATTGEPAA